MTDIEERATQMGWKPQEEFRGNPDNWVDADTFISNAETSLPIAKGTIKKLESELTETKQTVKQLLEYNKGVEKRAYDRALKDLQKQQLQAVEEGDTERFKEVQKDIDQLVSTHPIAAVHGAQATPNAVPDVVKEWKAANPWYGKDPEMAIYARQIDDWLRDNNPNDNPREHLAKVTEMVKEKFPDKFENTARRSPAAVEGGESLATVKSNGKKSFHSLPQEAKEMCDRLVKDGWIKSREDFLKDYQW